MKSFLGWVGTLGLIALAFVLYALPQLPETAYAATTTIIGWNFPNAATFGNGLMALILPIAGVGLFAGIPIALGTRGDFVVTMTLIGLTIGSVLGTLTTTLTGPSSSGLIPFGLIVESGLFLVLWMWKGGAG